MEHYQRGEVVTRELHLLSDLKLEENVIHMKVQGHSRMHSLLSFAMNKINVSHDSENNLLNDCIFIISHA